MNRRRVAGSSVVGLVLILVGVLGTPAQGAKNGGSIDELRASDQEIVKAIADLDAQIAAQQAELAAAQQAYDAAQQAVAQVEAKLKTATDRLDAIKASIRNRALEEYMAPREDSMTQILNSDGFGEASRRDELLRQLSNTDGDVLDEMKGLKKDIDIQHAAADAGRKVAEKRRNDAKKKLDDLNAARADKAKAEQVLKDRIAAATAEDEAAGFTGEIGDGGSLGGGISWPVRGNHPVTSGFGSRWGRLHAGIDVGIPVGTTIVAAKGGKVTFAGPASGYGNYVCIQSSEPMMTCYGHLSRISTSVGAQVATGAEIAKSGNTGTSTGAHLHFETCAGNGKPACFFSKKYSDPRKYLP